MTMGAPYVGRTKDRSIPVTHEEIFAILEAVAAGLSTKTLLALLELLQQAEVAGDLGSHGDFACEMCDRRV